MTRRRIVVHGLVHGVGFREATRREAGRAGVAGWVRNRQDGTVEAVLEGPAAAVDRLVAFAHQGPRGAIVTRVDASEEPPEGLRGFAVRA